jgi:hypothetical protein
MTEKITTHGQGCLVCGQDLEYSSAPVLRFCHYCGSSQETTVACASGHYVCDRCHSAQANDLIEKVCIGEERSPGSRPAGEGDREPVSLAMRLMSHPAIKMHGPEHHFLVPAVLLACYYDHLGRPDEKAAKIREARRRAEQVLGGFCGTHGACGAAVGTGVAISLITEATPLSGEEWRLSNRLTARTLAVIAEHGGPRCCKRDTMLALQEAVACLGEELGVQLPVATKVRCSFFHRNRECLRQGCPYFPSAV